MRKFIFALLGLCILASGAMAAPPNHVDTKVFLAEKVPTTPEPPFPEATIWTPKFGGGYGYLTYRVWGPVFNFKIQGFKLQRHTPYALIYYPDPFPGKGLIILAKGTANGGGNLTLLGKVDTGTLPANLGADANFPGAKIWLVPNPDLYIVEGSNGFEFFNWPMDPVSGAGILFETTLINYYKTN
jgi:hypothetical protein